MNTRRALVAGNWKMNGLTASLAEVEGLLPRLAPVPACDVMLCPPATLLARMSALTQNKIALGGQDCHAAASGAHTGDVSAEMLRDAGATAVIVGHSERRLNHHETDATVRAKAEAAHRAGLIAIVCIGETIDQRRAGKTLEVVLGQLDGSLPDTITGATTVVAYEPVWAIGTGLTPSTSDVAEVHAALRRRLVSTKGPVGNSVRILYGGSVKPSNARELMAVSDVDGALVGGASLKADDFYGIIAAYR